ncbi:MAG TPA: hypothetical protein VGH01_05275, partial [Jatrophihabitantaceae bacterium]
MSAPIAAAGPVHIAAGQSALDAAREAGLDVTGPTGVVVVRDGDRVLHDLDWAPEQDTDVEPVSANSPDGIAVLRHSTAHVLAQAVQ